MDIIKELDRLPTFAYTFELSGKLHLALLGGQSCQSITDIKYATALIDINSKMKKIYDKKALDEGDKMRLAKLMHQISGLCEGRLENNRSLEQQTNYLASLPSDSLAEIENQINMYKDAREYYRQYIFRS